MAATLTAVGLLLVRVRSRLEDRVASLHRTRFLARLLRAAPVATPALVLLVGLSLVARGMVAGA